MKCIAASTIATLALILALPAYACIPIQANPHRDAAEAETIFIGTVVALKTKPPSDDWREIAVTIKSSASLRGSAPPSVLVWLGCADYYPKVNDQVLVVHRDGYNFIRRAGGEYEKLLRADLHSGR